MKPFLIFLGGFLVVVTTTAQQVPNPAPHDAVVGYVPTNAALKTRTYKSAPVYRAGFANPGDGGAAMYFYGAAPCTIGGGDGDDGSQVKASVSGCWNMVPQGTVDLRVFGAKGGASFDSGPAIRAAAFHSEQAGATISVTRAPGSADGAYYMNTLEPTGDAALTLGKLCTPVQGQPCTGHGVSFIGTSWASHPDTCFTQSPGFRLGPNLNRPLILAKQITTGSRFERLCLSGMRPNQTGYPGGPNNKLYTIVAETQTGSPPSPANIPESSFVLHEVIVRDGFNGNVYTGGYRGIFHANNVWSVYSGQDATDIGMHLDGYDNSIYNIQQGRSTGYGIVLGANANTIITGGGTWMNDKTGLFLQGPLTIDSQITNLRIQNSGCHGLEIGQSAAPAGRNARGHVFVGLMFDGNAEGNEATLTAPGACSDIYHHGGSLFRDSFTGTVFGGPANATGIKPKHNIEFGPLGGARVSMNGSVFSDTPNTAGFTNDFKSVVGDYQFTPTWEPKLVGTISGGAGTETSVAGYPTGHWSRYGKQVTASGMVNLSAFYGTGNAIVNFIPLTSEVNSNTSCGLSNVQGWTAPAGYTRLTGYLGPNNNVMSIMKEGSGATAMPSNLTEWTAPIRFVISCSYPTSQ